MPTLPVPLVDSLTKIEIKMSLIEGVGDEVVQFIAIILAIIVSVIAWWSTNARPERYRTVVLMRSRPQSGSVFNFVSRPSRISGIRRLLEGPIPVRPLTFRRRSVNDPTNPERVVPLQEMDSIVDADMAMLDNNRLHFYRRMDSSPTTTTSSESTSDENEVEILDEGQSASNDQRREMDSIVSAMEADGTTGFDLFARPSESNSDQNSNPSSTTESGTSGVVLDDSRKILIKLKYINDTLKEVDGNLDELLKDFKRRHFSAELGAERRVRLIFRGRVLGNEAATLGACGLHDNAVVHCLVQPNRSSRTQRSNSPRQRNTPDTTNLHPELLTETLPVQDRAWDLEYMLMTLVSVALTVVWFFRCEYSNMFTASASVALFSLTVFYGLAIFGLYLSDTFHLERRPATPVAPEQPLTDN